MAKILIVDDERSIRNTLKEILEYEGYKVDEAQDGEEGLKKITTGSYDLALCDIKMPKKDGMEVLVEARKAKPEMAMIMISGHGNIETAVECTRHGAFDFISKPPDLNRLLITVRNALERTDLVVETKTLKRKVNKVQDIIGESQAIKDIIQTIEQVAPTEARVMITGQNGTGKELVARWLHEYSERASGPFIEVNCAAIPSELIESELFGHEKGAFTSAHKQRKGKFEEAHKGTIFLDEIGDMDVNVQAKVLRALQENKITRVGGNKDIKVDVRVVAATNKDLEREIEKQNFRLDLFHRLNVINIHVPPLNDRGDDIKILAKHFLEEICKEYNMPVKSFSKEALESLMNYHWTGNIRELRNVVERLLILSGKKITGDDVAKYTNPLKLQKSEDAVFFDSYNNLEDFLSEAEKSYVQHALRKSGGSVTAAADKLMIKQSELKKIMDKFGLN